LLEKLPKDTHPRYTVTIHTLKKLSHTLKKTITRMAPEANLLKHATKQL